MELEEKKISSQVKFEGKVIVACYDKILLPDGNVGEREYIKHKGAVAVIPVDNDKNVYMVEQYRYACGRVFLEIPAGKYDYVGEDELQAGLRELKEETGATSNKMTDLGYYISSPAICTEKIKLYMAEDLSFGERNLDDDEFINVKKYSLEKLVKMVMNGEIEDGKTQLAILKANEILK